MRERINDKILEKLKELRFVDEINFKMYDMAIIEDDYVELYREEEWDRDDNYDYVKIRSSLTRQFKKNNLSGVFVEF